MLCSGDALINKVNEYSGKISCGLAAQSGLVYSQDGCFLLQWFEDMVHVDMQSLTGSLCLVLLPLRMVWLYMHFSVNAGPQIFPENWGRVLHQLEKMRHSVEEEKNLSNRFVSCFNFFFCVIRVKHASSITINAFVAVLKSQCVRPVTSAASITQYRTGISYIRSQEELEKRHL